MGEAKRRREARAEAFGWGRPIPAPTRCPACQSSRLHRIPIAEQGAILRKYFSCDLETCLDCKAIWEPFPAAGYVEDPVCAAPCDNCAFRPGSPEQQDREGWKALLAKLRPDGAENWYGDARFYCHKGIPIDMAKGPGNFLFPTKPVTMDGKPMHQADGSPVTMPDAARMRTCTGFLRMLWAQRVKRERG